MADESFTPARAEKVAQILEQFESDGKVSIDTSFYAYLWLADDGRIEELVGGDRALTQFTPANLRAISTSVNQWLQKGELSRAGTPSTVPTSGFAQAIAGPAPKSPDLAQPLTPIMREGNSDIFAQPVTPIKRKRDSDISGGGSSERPPQKVLKLQASPTGQRKSATQLTKQRDGNRCILQKTPSFDVRPIFPFSMRVYDESFWATLRMFWSAKDQRMERCRLRRGRHGDPAEPGLLKSSGGSTARDRKFALKYVPNSLSSDETSMELGFHWLNCRPSAGQITMAEAARQPSLAIHQLWTDGLYNYENGPVHGSNYHSGQVTRLTTSDPKSMPLPYPSIIDLQWHLNRVAALSGADPEDLDDDWDQDERELLENDPMYQDPLEQDLLDLEQSEESQ
ncbi:hypothetical protein FQN57_006090 [Myotisia sp. PD_48]|nr:hypothetical protein FQN57_006090 [Myotisia sp. PD_48]